VTALVVGAALAIAALAFVLYPLFFRSASGRPPETVAKPEENLAVAALREIEFDHVTGKLSDADYAQLRDRYSREALAIMRGEPASRPAGPAIAFAVPDDVVEAAIRSFRKGARGCGACGPRPESDALFCSNCGRYLSDRCAACGTPVEALDARYCVNCGRQLAA